jgi:putative peptide zinc metalloprotease protein
MMQQQNIFSPYWYRVANLVPRLRKHVQLHRHEYRGQDWYVLQDHSSGRFHRFSVAAYQLIGLMDGRHDMDQIWKHASQSLAENSLTQGQAIQLLAQLYKADALSTDVSPDTEELFQRQYTSQRRLKLQKWKSPLSIRVPLIDPDKFIVATLPLVSKLFSIWGLLFWLLVVGSSTVMAFTHWPELTENLVDRVLAGQNVLVLLLTFPLVKLVHEFGHAYAARVQGGEIHEMGVMFLILMPIPYVDATSSSAFASRWQRALVASAGMLTELFIASIALHIWLSVEPGFISAVMYNTMIIAGVSTLLFNANPLIRFDGYYILVDLIEIPNLGTRSTRYLGYLIQKYLFGVEGIKSPANAPGERGWFLAYGIASFIYRLFLISFIVFLLADQYFIVGIILAIWAVVMMAIMPVYKQIKFLMTNKKLSGKRTRAITISIAFIALLGGLALLPVQLVTVVEGVVWADQDSRVRMDSQGFVDEILVNNGEQVHAGQVILVCKNFELEANQQRLQAQLAQLRAQYDAVTSGGRFQQDRIQAELAKEQIIATEAQLLKVEKQIDLLRIKSPADGQYVALSSHSLLGRFLQRGEVVGFIARSNRATVRVLVPQHRIHLVRQQTESITVRAADQIGVELSARVSREVPHASQDLPSAALSFEGGGEIATNPNQQAAGNLSTFTRWFQMDIEIDRQEDEIGLGERVYARFKHGKESLGLQIYRSIRQTFLSKFNV